MVSREKHWGPTPIAVVCARKGIRLSGPKPICLSPERKEKIMLRRASQETRGSDPQLAVRLVIAGCPYSIISGYAPQSGMSDEDKHEFFEKLDDLVSSVPPEERLIIGADLNGHGDSITKYRANVKEKRQTFCGKTGNEKWTTTKDVILKAVEGVCGKTRVVNTK
eukprot:gene12382-3040_t